MKKKYRILIILVFGLSLLIKSEMDFNPSIRILSSVINFSESTLNNPNYLAYGIDLKDLFRNYTNSDIRYSGSAYIKKVKDFPYSINGNIKGERSSEQKKFSCKADLNVVVLQVGELDVYAENDIVYLVAPLLGGISYGFDTGENLFIEAPNLNHDITREWFHDNKGNIYEFVNSIEINRTENVYVDEDGVKAEEFSIVIPQGEGDFIWELLGLTPPDHDIKCSIYLDKLNHTRKLVFDLSYKTKGAYLSIYGNHLNTVELYVPLPDDEYAVATIKRNGNVKYTNSYINNLTYHASNGDNYYLEHGVLLNYIENGIKIEMEDVTVKQNDTVLAEGYVTGKIHTVENMGDVFENAGADLSEVNVIDWDTIKNDTASFVDDVIDQARKNVNLLDLLD